MGNIVKINIDLHTGAVAIESPDEALDRVFDHLESFLPSLIDAKAEFDVDLPSEEQSPEQRREEAAVQEPPAQPDKPKRKRSPGKPESFKAVDLALDSAKRDTFKSFYASKAPKGQSQQVLAVIYWLLKNTDRSELTADEIFTGLRTVGEKVPKRLTSVLSNLTIDSMIIRKDGRFTLHHIGEDFVEHDLPAKKP